MEPGSARLLAMLREDHEELTIFRSRDSSVFKNIEKYLKAKFDNCYFCNKISEIGEISNSHTVPRAKIEIISENHKVIDLNPHKILFKDPNDIGNFFDLQISERRSGVFRSICKSHDKAKFSPYEDSTLDLVDNKQMESIALKTSLSAIYFHVKECYRIQMMWGDLHLIETWAPKVYQILSAYSDCANYSLLAADKIDTVGVKHTVLFNDVVPKKSVFAMQSYFPICNTKLREIYRIYVNVLPEEHSNRILIFTDGTEEQNTILKNDFSVANVIISGIFNMKSTSSLSPSLSASAEKSSLIKVIGSQSYSNLPIKEQLEIMKLLNLKSMYVKDDSWDFSNRF